MELANKITVVTGAAGGIGRALVESFHKEGATVVLADTDQRVLNEISDVLNRTRSHSALAIAGDLTTETANANLIAAAEREFGQIDLFFANAGVGVGTDLTTTEEVWETALNINVNAHRWAAKYLIQGWLDRGDGYFCSTASAAGLLSQIGSAPYSVTKHAARAFAEWMSITYGNRGIKVSCLCPQGVNTNMLKVGDTMGAKDSSNVVRIAGAVLEPQYVAEVVVQAIRDETFLILPHPEVAQYATLKASENERWLAGMRKLQKRALGV